MRVDAVRPANGKPSRSAFARLRALLDELAPAAGLEPIPLHLGESRLARPKLDPAVLGEVSGWADYPELGGGSRLREAYASWLERRFGLRRGIEDGSVLIEPTPGAKQAVAAAIALAVQRKRAALPQPIVIVPNPCYPTYRAAAEAIGARTVFAATGDPDDAGSVVAAVRTAAVETAAVVLCRPGNPRGEILAPGALRAIAEAAAAADAWLVVDECYIDVTHDCRPAGFLQLAATGHVPAVPYLVLHSLSKRSGMPGLRSGFAAGDPGCVTAYAEYNRTCGVSSAAPVNAAAAHLWSDDAHVERAREALRRNWDMADRLLGDVPGYRRSAAGFFLWLPVADARSTARRLWREQALTAMPGDYLAAAGPDGVNPGEDHLRIALVHEPAPMREALGRLRAALI